MGSLLVQCFVERVRSGEMRKRERRSEVGRLMKLCTDGCARASRAAPISRRRCARFMMRNTRQPNNRKTPTSLTKQNTCKHEPSTWVQFLLPVQHDIPFQECNLISYTGLEAERRHWPRRSRLRSSPGQSFTCLRSPPCFSRDLSSFTTFILSSLRNGIPNNAIPACLNTTCAHISTCNPQPA